MRDVIASELHTLVVLLKERDEGVSMRTIIQFGKVDELLERHDDLSGAGRLRALYQRYRDALEAVHVSVEVYFDRDEVLAAAEEALAARNAALPVGEQVHGEVQA
jgi:hypothetical protein